MIHLIFSLDLRQNAWRLRTLLVAACLIAGVLAFMALLQTHCRTSVLGFGFALLVLFIFKLAGPRLKILALLTTLFIGLIIGAAVMRSSTEYRANRIQQSPKNYDIYLRTARWLNTWAGIQSAPWRGVGPGQFEFSYVRFHNAVMMDDEVTEAMIPKSPHNSYLGLLFELGLPIGLTLIFCAALVFVRFFNRPTASPIQTTALIVCSFLAVDALTAFPFELAYPFFIAALWLGLAHGDQLKSKSHRSLNFLIVVAGLLSAGFTVLYLQAKWNEAQPTDLASFAIADRTCRLFAESWHSCILASRLAREHGDFNRAAHYLDLVIKNQPANFVAWRDKVSLTCANGDSKECSVARGGLQQVLPQ